MHCCISPQGSNSSQVAPADDGAFAVPNSSLYSRKGPSQFSREWFVETTTPKSPTPQNPKDLGLVLDDLLVGIAYSRWLHGWVCHKGWQGQAVMRWGWGEGTASCLHRQDLGGWIKGPCLVFGEPHGRPLGCKWVWQQWVHHLMRRGRGREREREREIDR